MFNKKPVAQPRRVSSAASSRIYSRENVSRYSERAKQRNRSKHIKVGILVAIVGVLVCGTVAAGSWFMRITQNLGNGDVITNDLLGVLTDSDVTREPFYVLLLGTDGRPGEDTYRADSIILARIDTKAKQATLISIPRDTKVTYKGSVMKINAAHALDGAEGMVTAVEKLTGVDINHYAEIDFNGMESLIDAIGGIDINATDEVNDPDHLDIVIEPGEQHMDGATALTYARCRYTYIDGDYTRMRHQRQVLGAMADKILNNLDVTSIPSLIESVSNIVTTDMGVGDILAVVNAMRGMDVNGIYSANVPSYSDETTYIDGQSYVFVYADELAEMMERVDAGEDPKGPNTDGHSDGTSATIGDLSDNTSEDFVNGTTSTGATGSQMGGANDVETSSDEEEEATQGYSSYAYSNSYE